MRKQKKLIWFAGWFPSDTNPMGGNFIARHAQAVATELGNSAEFESTLSVFHFPLYLAGEKVPLPAKDKDFQWVKIKQYPVFSSGQSSEYYASVGADNSGIRLHWMPIVQFNQPWLKPINALWYWLCVVAFLLDFTRKNPPERWLIHLHAGDKIAWPLGFLKQYFWKSSDLWYTEHWAIFGNDVADNYANRSRFFRGYMRRIWKLSDVSAAISLFTHQQLQHTYRCAKRMFLFRNPVDHRSFYPRHSEAMGVINTMSASNCVVWLHVSNFDNRKQIPTIIQAYLEVRSRFPGIFMELHLVGGDKNALLSKNPEIPLDWFRPELGIVVEGALSPNELGESMRNSQALVLFSTAENVPCVIAEAQCCGLPVITNRLAGIPEMQASDLLAFTSGNGLADLVESMRVFIESGIFSKNVTAEERMQIQKDSSSNAMEMFHSARIAREILSAYQRYTP